MQISTRCAESISTLRFAFWPGRPAARFWRALRGLLAGVAVFGLLAPFLAVAHELIVLGAAFTLSTTVGFLSTWPYLRALPLDPIYTSAMLLTLGGIEPRGLALAAPIGDWLHAAWPNLFESPSLVAPVAWASAVVEPGATIASRWLCGMVADACVIGAGLVALRRGRAHAVWLVVGAIVQANVLVSHLVDAPPALADVEAAGVPFGIAMLVSGDVQAGPRLSEMLANLSQPTRNIVLGLGLTALAYLPIVLLIGGRHLVHATLVASRRWRSWRVRSLTPQGQPRALRVRRASRFRPMMVATHLAQRLALGVLAVGIVLSPVGGMADAQTHFLASTFDDGTLPSDAAYAEATATDVPSEPPPTQDVVAAVTDPASPTTVAPTATPEPVTAPTDPAVVAVTGEHYQYQYTVNGVPKVIRGMGYNVRYRFLPPEERAQRLDRDFAALHAAGVTTIFGWEPAEFDEMLLDTALRHGLGVAPPFELDPDAAYNDPAVRARITDEVLAWVARYRQHPAVRMWAIGNEVLHKLVYPSWMPIRSDPAWEQRARDFAAFYVELIDKVHAADPLHPIVHRDAEDAYFTWLRDAFGTTPRPWFIYGVNVYTPRLAEILAKWPSQGWDVPLMVSEFAPGGMSPADRPEGFRSMWKMIRAAGGWVLGGAVYAWTTDGPEEIDRVFGLVDAGGTPVDGAFNTIGAVYRGVSRQLASDRAVPGATRDEPVWAFAGQAIGEIQAGHASGLLPVTADTSLMGDMGSIPKDGVSPDDLTVERVVDQRRMAWARDAGIAAEWWVTWRPPSQPRQKLTFVVRQAADGTFGVHSIYHGPR